MQAVKPWGFFGGTGIQNTRVGGFLVHVLHRPVHPCCILFLLDLALDFMVWNVTKDNIRTRMGVPNEESFPAPVQRVKEPPNSMEAYKWTDFSLSGVEPESAAVTNALIEKFNKENGTDIKPGITGLPFQKK